MPTLLPPPLLPPSSGPPRSPAPPSHPSLPRLRLHALLLVLALAAATILTACNRTGPESAAAPEDAPVLTLNIDPGVKTFEVNRRLAEEFTSRTGVRVHVIKGPAESTERLSQYFQILGARSPDIDVYQVDTVWPAMLAEHFVDLKPAFANELDQFFPSVVANNTTPDGRLIAAPWFVDAGLLYYRTDLLKKYGYAAPPSTWDELTTMAMVIQRGERAAGSRDFWGFIWQGKAYEGLTCNALEWIASTGGGTILGKAGGKVARVTVDNPQAVRAVARAAGWVGTISPRGVTAFAEEDARQLFQAGNAAFMRNWPYAHALAAGDESAVRGRFDVAPLPSGGDRPASALGGWQLSVSRYSRHPGEAIALVKHLTSPEAMRLRALEGSMLPARPAVYDEPELAAKVPFLPVMKKAVEAAVPRPAAAAGDDYNEVSTYFFQHVHRALTRQKTPDQAMGDLARLLQEVLE